MEFTGERFIPDGVREIWYEHWHRYAFASQFVAGARVLDLACGEGYGSHLLASKAQHVTGVDVSQAAVDHARASYQSPNLEFKQGNATAIPLPDDSCDVVVSFETLEHLAEQAAMLTEFRRVLRDSGYLIISSPDKKTYSDETGYHNEYHVQELYRDELIALLQKHFRSLRLFGQKLLFHSLIWDLGSSADASYSAHILDRDSGQLQQGLSYVPLYYLVFCAANVDALPVGLPGVSLFADQAESVYTHYNGEIKKNMAAGGLLAERDAEIRRLRGALKQGRGWRRWLPKGKMENND